MTLIAAYRESGIPALLGDFLITQSGKATSPLKKVRRMEQNLVVGWTGHLVAARTVLTDLHYHFHSEFPRKEALDRFFTDYPTNDLALLSVTLVGWIIDNGEYCFRWSSDQARSVVYKDSHFAGSGEAVSQRMFGTGINIKSDDLAEPAARILLTCARLLMDEVSARIFQTAMGFGHAYEALYRNKNTFQYVDDVLYVFCEVCFDRRGHYMEARLHPTVYKYNHISDHAVIQISNLGQNATHERHLMTPVCRVSKAVDRAIEQQVFSKAGVSLQFGYGCLVASLIKDADTNAAEAIPPVSFVSAHGKLAPLA